MPSSLLAWKVAREVAAAEGRGRDDVFVNDVLSGLIFDVRLNVEGEPIWYRAVLHGGVFRMEEAQQLVAGAANTRRTHSNYVYWQPSNEGEGTMTEAKFGSQVRVAVSRTHSSLHRTIIDVVDLEHTLNSIIRYTIEVVRIGAGREVMEVVGEIKVMTESILVYCENRSRDDRSKVR